jgi:hypothetical protein
VKGFHHSYDRYRHQQMWMWDGFPSSASRRKFLSTAAATDPGSAFTTTTIETTSAQVQTPNPSDTEVKEIKLPSNMEPQKLEAGVMPPKTTWADLGVPVELNNHLVKLDFKEPSEIQRLVSFL